MQNNGSEKEREKEKTQGTTQGELLDTNKQNQQQNEKNKMKNKNEKQGLSKQQQNSENVQSSIKETSNLIIDQTSQENLQTIQINEISKEQTNTPNKLNTDIGYIGDQDYDEYDDDQLQYDDMPEEEQLQNEDYFKILEREILPHERKIKRTGYPLKLIWLEELNLFMLLNKDQAGILKEQQCGFKYMNQWFLFSEEAYFLMEQGICDTFLFKQKLDIQANQDISFEKLVSLIQEAQKEKIESVVQFILKINDSQLNSFLIQNVYVHYRRSGIYLQRFIKDQTLKQIMCFLNLNQKTIMLSHQIQDKELISQLFEMGHKHIYYQFKSKQALQKQAPDKLIIIQSVDTQSFSQEVIQIIQNIKLKVGVIVYDNQDKIEINLDFIK